jgi:hypothetical protein
MKRSLIALAAVAAAHAFGAPAGLDRPGRRIVLGEDDDKARMGLVRFLSTKIELAEGAKETWVTITRTGDFSDPRYGDFKITPTHLEQMVKNFDSGVLGQDVFLDVAHKPSDGAAGKFTKLTIENGRLRGLVQWTEFGMDAVKKRGFAYLSAEYHENWKDNEKQVAHGCVLLGAGLTTRPVIKNLDPVTLSEQDDDHAPEIRVAVSPSLLRELTERRDMNFLEQLKAKLKALGLAEGVVTMLLAQAKTQLEAAADDKAREALVLSWEETGKAIDAEVKKLGGAGGNVTITLAQPGGQQVDLASEIAKVLAQQASTAAADKAKVDANLKLLSDTLAEEKSLTPEGVVKLAADVAPLVTSASTPEQIKALAALQLKNWSAQSAATKLASLGFRTPTGNVQIVVEGGSEIKALQAEIDKRLGLTEKKDPKRFELTGGELLSANEKFAERVLAEYDAAYGADLVRERKALAAGDGSVSDVAVPRIVERTVIREVLYNLISLQLMDVGTAPFANVIDIPYSYRDGSAAGVNALRRYELQAIRKAGIIQTTEETRPIPQKLAFRIASEMQMLLSASTINFDAIAENLRNMVRIVGEDTEAINLNELAQSADEYGAIAVVAENRGADVNGVKRIYPLANFPVVKPRKVYDLKGVQVGNTLNPITVTLGGVVRNEYALPADGSALAAGTYWVMNYNLGELQFVDQVGAPVTPANGTALTVSYSYSTNVKKFDTDQGAVDTDVFWDTLLFAIGGRKAVIEDDRYYTPNMILMSGNVNNQLSQAKTFQANSARTATSLASDGSVGLVKDMPVWRPRAPGTLFGDTRILVGERATSRFRMVKPWEVTPLEQARDANGNFIDGKEAFGHQWIASHTPTQLKGSKTSVILYSTAGRVARA